VPPPGRQCNHLYRGDVRGAGKLNTEAPMGFGRGILLWMLGIPLPIIILLALFWR
jgi:hypothetical protein